VKLSVKTTAGLNIEGQTERIVFDDDIKGFGLRLREGGSRTWIYQYRIGSKQRRMVLGSATAVPLSVARKNAGELEARVKLGGDPAMDKETARRSADETFGVLVDQYLAARQSKWRPATEREVRRHLTKYAKSLHRFPIAAVSQLNISNLLDSLAKESGDATSNRVRANLSTFLSWVIKRGIDLPKGNIASYTEKQKENSRTRVLSDGELKTIWSACSDDAFGAILKLLLLTGQRKSEIGLLRWDEVRDEHILLPGARTKNKRDHVVPLSERLKQYSKSFASTAGRMYSVATTPGLEAGMPASLSSTPASQKPESHLSIGRCTICAVPLPPAWPIWECSRILLRRYSITSQATRAALPVSITARHTIRRNVRH
jgi:hypothetical protein